MLGYGKEGRELHVCKVVWVTFIIWTEANITSVILLGWSGFSTFFSLSVEEPKTLLTLGEWLLHLRSPQITSIWRAICQGWGWVKPMQGVGNAGPEGTSSTMVPWLICSINQKSWKWLNWGFPLNSQELWAFSNGLYKKPTSVGICRSTVDVLNPLNSEASLWGKDILL